MPAHPTRAGERSVVALVAALAVPVAIGMLTASMILDGRERLVVWAGAALVFLAIGLTRPRAALWAWLLFAPLGDRYALVALPVGLPDVTFSRGIGALIAAALLLRFVLKGERVRLAGPFTAAMLALAAVMGIDLLWRGSDITSEVLKDFDELGLPALLFLGARHLFTRRSDMRTAAWCLTLVGLYLGTHGVLQYFAFTSPDSTVAEVAIERVDGGRVNENFLAQGRSVGPFGSPVEYGSVAGICFSAALFLVLRPARGRFARLVPLAATAAAAAAVILSATRSAWLALPAAAVVMASMQRGKRAMMVVGIALVTTVAGTLIFALPQSEMFVGRATGAESIGARTATYRIGLRLAARRPLTGYGTGEPALRAAAEEAASMGTAVGDAASGQLHNTFLSMLVEWGILGPIVYGTVLVILLRIVFAARQATSAGDELHDFTGLVFSCWAIFLLQHLVVDTPPFHFLNSVCFLLVGLVHAQVDGRASDAHVAPARVA